ncbi:MAG: hypothetical protein JSS09_06705, partial [Verrucomicrobia bacterium]|nr:hypothetical protein [Verrucomicrobiota bacterium]
EVKSVLNPPTPSSYILFNDIKIPEQFSGDFIDRGSKLGSAILFGINPKEKDVCKIHQEFENRSISEPGFLAVLTLIQQGLLADVTNLIIAGTNDANLDSKIITRLKPEYTITAKFENGVLKIEAKVKYFDGFINPLDTATLNGSRELTRTIEIPIANLQNVEISLDEGKSEYAFINLDSLRVKATDIWGPYKPNHQTVLSDFFSQHEQDDTNYSNIPIQSLKDIPLMTPPGPYSFISKPGTKHTKSIDPIESFKEVLKDGGQYIEKVGRKIPNTFFDDMNRTSPDILSIKPSQGEAVSSAIKETEFNSIVGQLTEKGLNEQGQLAVFTLMQQASLASITDNIQAALSNSKYSITQKPESLSHTLSISPDEEILHLEIKVSFFDVENDKDTQIVKGYRTFTRTINIPIAELN